MFQTHGEAKANDLSPSSVLVRGKVNLPKANLPILPPLGVVQTATPKQSYCTIVNDNNR